MESRLFGIICVKIGFTLSNNNAPNANEIMLTRLESYNMLLKCNLALINFD